MQSTVTGISIWSRWQRERGLFFNSFFLEDPAGNVAIDPLAADDDDLAEIDRRGGLAWIVVTNRDHLRDAPALASRFGAKIATSAADAALIAEVPVARVLADGDEIAGGRVIALDGLKTPGEFALSFRERSTVLVGDALWGDPAGSVRLMPDDRLADPARAVRSLRRLAACRAQHLLVGDGASLFGDAWKIVWRALEARPETYVNAINTDELPLVTTPVSTLRPHYGELTWCDAGALIGAERLGYAYARLAPGKRFCPMHWHTREEELFVVLAGTATLHTPRGDFSLRAGDLVAFPTGANGAHQIVATGESAFEMLAIANTDPGDVCFYPESQKLLVEATGTLVRDHPGLDYYDAE